MSTSTVVATDAQFVANNRKWLGPYVHELIRAANLSHWRIALVDDPPEDNCSATVELSGNYQYARLLVADPCEETIETPDHALRRSIVHELVHIHLHDWEQTIYALEDHLNPATWHIVQKQLRRTMERTVDAIATAWAETLPLPMRGATNEPTASGVAVDRAFGKVAIDDRDTGALR